MVPCLPSEEWKTLPECEVTVNKVENKTAFFKETVECLRLIFWPVSQRRVHYHAVKPEPNRRVTIGRAPLLGKSSVRVSSITAVTRINILIKKSGGKSSDGRQETIYHHRTSFKARTSPLQSGLEPTIEVYEQSKCAPDRAVTLITPSTHAGKWAGIHNRPGVSTDSQDSWQNCGTLDTNEWRETGSLCWVGC
jgi:hypothetical protein